MRIQILLLVAGTTLSMLMAGCRSDGTGGSGNTPMLTDPVLLIPVGTVRTPRGIAVDAGGDIWVSDTPRDRILRFNRDGSLKDSVVGYILPTTLGRDQATGHILAVVNERTIVRINPANNASSVVLTVSEIGLDTTTVLDVNTLSVGPQGMTILTLGDIDGVSNGNIYVTALVNQGRQAVFRVQPSGAMAFAYSGILPPNPSERSPMFLAADPFGSIYTGFMFQTGPASVGFRLMELRPNSLTSSRVLFQPSVSGAASGAGFDVSGYLYIADPPFQELVIVTTSTGRVIDALPMPSIPGISQPTPLDVALGLDGSVFVAVGDLLVSADGPGAVLKYSRTSR